MGYQPESVLGRQGSRARMAYLAHAQFWPGADLTESIGDDVGDVIAQERGTIQRPGGEKGRILANDMWEDVRRSMQYEPRESVSARNASGQLGPLGKFSSSSVSPN